MKITFEITDNGLDANSKTFSISKSAAAENAFSGEEINGGAPSISKDLSASVNQDALLEQMRDGGRGATGFIDHLNNPSIGMSSSDQINEGVAPFASQPLLGQISNTDVVDIGSPSSSLINSIDEEKNTSDTV